MARNYLAWGEKRKGAIAVAAGVLVTLMLAGLGMWARPEATRSSISLIGVIAAKYLAKHFQGDAVARYRAAGGAVASWWRACGISLGIGAVIILGAIGYGAVTSPEATVDGPYPVSSAAIPAIHQKLVRAKADQSFAAVIFFADGKQDDDHAVNLQFSYEDQRVGLDWVLRAPVNLRDQGRFRVFAERLGYRVETREANGVRYLRVEKGGDLQALFRRVLQEQYGLAPDAELGLMVSGISWP